ncbi:GerMN domain-containing protein [Selenomonas ruminis]|uniref:GerMN domain-containing protein n=1 Tax=Selenomonas ruminis TaxID=2593411 RepID=A0A5D6W9H9_9FIRM|nr:GerMN domain-containing protein [Selenomonas sp. mPRGC5]TYZ24546.1 GerMN domain-containing protein [Selenomonas sp. mPRGC5]
MKRLRVILLAVLALTLLVTAGCDPNNEKGTPGGTSAAVSGNSGTSAGSAASSSGTQTASKKMNIKVYYPDEQGMKLIAVKRTIKSDDAGKYAEAMKSLLQGPKDKGQIAVIPKQAKLRSVKVKDDVAYVDFSQDLVKQFTGGSTGEEMLVGSVVNTLTDFPEIKKVQILVEGKKIETLAGHMDLSAPIARMANLLK